MERYSRAETAERAGILLGEVSRLVELGILMQDAEGSFTRGDVRRAGLVNGLAGAGVPLDDLGAAIRRGQVSPDFLDAPS